MWLVWAVSVSSRKMTVFEQWYQNVCYIIQFSADSTLLFWEFTYPLLNRTSTDPFLQQTPSADMRSRDLVFLHNLHHRICEWLLCYTGADTSFIAFMLLMHKPPFVVEVPPNFSWRCLQFSTNFVLPPPTIFPFFVSRSAFSIVV